MSLCLFCFNLGIWGSAFSILLNQVIGGDTDEKKSEEGELELGKDQNLKKSLIYARIIL